jgi:hypothetical protein
VQPGAAEPPDASARRSIEGSKWESPMAIVAVNGGGNIPQGDYANTFTCIPVSNTGGGDVDGRDFLIWQRGLGATESELASETGLSDNSVEPRDETADLLGSMSASDWLVI